MSSTSASNDPAPSTDNSGRGSGGRNSRNGGRGNGRGSGGRGARSQSNQQVQSTDGVSFEGACPEVGAVMGLRTEKFNKNVPFATFKDKFADYVIRSIKYGSYIEKCIRHVLSF